MSPLLLSLSPSHSLGFFLPSPYPDPCPSRAPLRVRWRRVRCYADSPSPRYPSSGLATPRPLPPLLNRALFTLVVPATAGRIAAIALYVASRPVFPDVHGVRLAPPRTVPRGSSRARLLPSVIAKSALCPTVSRCLASATIEQSSSRPQSRVASHASDARVARELASEQDAAACVRPTSSPDAREGKWWRDRGREKTRRSRGHFNCAVR